MARKVSITEFKRLLYDIRDRRPDVRVRVRMIGKMWAEDFCVVDVIRENECTLFDDSRNKILQITNLQEVIQFELECPFFGYQAFYHYDLVGQTVETVST
jgi:hypothetical protein